MKNKLVNTANSFSSLSLCLMYFPLIRYYIENISITMSSVPGKYMDRSENNSSFSFCESENRFSSFFCLYFCFCHVWLACLAASLMLDYISALSPILLLSSNSP